LLRYERNGFSPDTLDILREWGHQVVEVDSGGSVQAVAVSDDGRLLEGGSDRRLPDGAAIGR
ncbi:MAG: gamma-glutamyltransferase, partial [Vicinamibacteria bacterium]